MPRKTQPTASKDLNTWRTIQPAPATLLYGSNDYFARRAQERLRNQFSQLHGETEREQLSAKDYKKGQLAVISSPSLFGVPKIIEFSQVASMSEDFLTDVLDYLQHPEADTILILHHSGGNRGKKLIDLFRASQTFNFVECKDLKREQEKLDFVFYEIRERGKKIDPQAAQMLVAATGSDLSELAAACAQLTQDGPDRITLQLVDRYYGGRTEATAFKVSDEAVRGNSRAALALLRHALETGVEPIPMIGALAQRIRNISRLYGSRGPSQALAGEMKMAPWQVEQAQRDGRRFSEADLAHILRVLADADAQLKGEAVDSFYAVEKAVLAIAQPGRSH